MLFLLPKRVRFLTQMDRAIRIWVRILEMLTQMGWSADFGLVFEKYNPNQI